MSLFAEKLQTHIPTYTPRAVRAHALSVDAILTLQSASFEDGRYLQSLKDEGVAYFTSACETLEYCSSDTEIKITRAFLNDISKILNEGCTLEDLTVLVNEGVERSEQISLEEIIAGEKELPMGPTRLQSHEPHGSEFHQRLADYVQSRYRTYIPLYLSGSSMDILHQVKSGYLSRENFLKLTKTLPVIHKLMDRVMGLKVYTDSTGPALFNEYSQKLANLDDEFKSVGFTYLQDQVRFESVHGFVTSESMVIPSSVGWTDETLGEASGMYTSLLASHVEPIVTSMQQYGMSLQGSSSEQSALCNLKTMTMERLFHQGSFALSMLESTLLRLGAIDEKESV